MSERAFVRIVLVEDNHILASGLGQVLQDAGHCVEHFDDGEKADQFLHHEGADLAIIDINLPTLNGLQIIQRIRARQHTFPVLILTARGSTNDRVQGLDAGADDYLVKPFAIAELEARIRALSRRREAWQPAEEYIGQLCYERNARRLVYQGQAIALARRELMLFEALLDKQGQFVSKSVLADTLYGIGSDTDLNAVELAVSRLRRALKGANIEIRTARGIGYMLEATAC